MTIVFSTQLFHVCIIGPPYAPNTLIWVVPDNTLTQSWGTSNNDLLDNLQDARRSIEGI